MFKTPKKTKNKKTKAKKFVKPKKTHENPKSVKKKNQQKPDK